jgi:hypothetical protein
MCTSQSATSCYLYKHRSRPIDVSNNRINIIYLYFSFYPSFSIFHRLDLLFTVSTPWVAVVLIYLPFSSDVTLSEEKLPREVPVSFLTIIRIDKIGSSGLLNQTVHFFCFEFSGSCGNSLLFRNRK